MKSSLPSSYFYARSLNLKSQENAHFQNLIFVDLLTHLPAHKKAEKFITQFLDSVFKVLSEFEQIWAKTSSHGFPGRSIIRPCFIVSFERYSAYLPSHLFSELRALINEEGKLENPPVITHLQVSSSTILYVPIDV